MTGHARGRLWDEKSQKICPKLGNLFFRRAVVAFFFEVHGVGNCGTVVVHICPWIFKTLQNTHTQMKRLLKCE